ncbi:MAG TPA: SpoIIE family protein phosphatase [Bacteroidales bacterium]|nr:SpoIIE family protein phosphatase [Bacteroidales bacterium]
MKKLLFVVFALIISCILNAQEGSPFLTHFREDRDIENQNWAICQDTNKMMLFANRKGILCFDGADWTPIRIPVTPMVMKINPSDGKIYIGGDNSFGFLERDHVGYCRYVELNDSTNIGAITNIIFHDSIACFIGDYSVTCLNIKSNAPKWQIFADETQFTGAFMLGENIYVNVGGKGLHRIEKDTLFPIVSGYTTENTEILFSLPYNEKRTIIGKDDGTISFFDGIKFYDYTIDDDNYLSNNVVADAISLGDSLYAFSTVGGGVLVSGKNSQKVRYIINNMKGLPDDEIFAIGSDASGGLWMSHPFGLTRADLNLPAGNYGIYPGLEGNLSTAVRYLKELYVATSEGVFYLAKEKRYTEVEVIKRTEIQEVKSKQKQRKGKEQSTELVPQKQTSSKKSLLTRIFGKKAADQTLAQQPASQIIETPDVSEMPVASFVTEKVRTLKSIDFVYKSIPGITEKCRQLVPTRYGVLAATNRGLYVIYDHKTTPIVKDRYINYISWNEESGAYSIAADDGYFFVRYKGGRWETEAGDENFNYPVYSIFRQTPNTVWLGTDNAAFKIVTSSSGGSPDYKSYSVENPFIQRYHVRSVNDTLFLFTETGVSWLDVSTDKFIPYKSLITESEIFKYPVSNVSLIIAGNDLVYNEKQRKIKERDLSLLKLFEDIASVYYDDDFIWVVDGDNRLFGIDTKKSSSTIRETDLLVRNVSNERGTSFDPSNIVFERGDNIINFDIVVPAYLNKNLTQYQYFIEGVMDEWSAWSSNKSYSKAISEPGDYTLMIRAKDLWGQVGDPVSLSFSIKAPFTETPLFYIGAIIIGLGIVLVVIRFREKQLHEKNRILEEKVKERTAEIEAQKEEITSSIEYASRIQMAMLPVSGLFNESFSDYFIIFKPRNIVSGDFYWIGADEKNLYLTVADCTGHGVPGAFMSMLGISVLNEIVTHNEDLKANTFLNLLREKIKILLHQTGKEGEAADGMDISLCVLDKKRQKLQFSGAYNSLYLFTDGELKELKADRMPIGIHYGEEASFSNNEMKIQKGDVIYLLSDGLTDQFGGPEGSKFKKAQLKKIVSEIYMKPMAEQKKLIELEFLKWKGNNSQVDDVTVIGVKI